MIRKGLIRGMVNAAAIFLSPRSPAAFYRNPFPLAAQAYARWFNLICRPLKIFSSEAECIVCGKRNYAFGKNAAVSVNLVSSRHTCLSCSSNARTRTALFILKKHLPKKRFSILDVGPISSTRKFFSRYNCRYLSLDKYGHADFRDDIQEMKSVKGGSFDFIMCVHILEHVEDDIRAMKEMRRILKKSGRIICMVPQVAGKKKTGKNPARPFRGYGHIWLYGEDFRKRMESAGFRIKVEKASDEHDILRYGLVRDDVYIAKKMRHNK